MSVPDLSRQSFRDGGSGVVKKGCFQGTTEGPNPLKQLQVYTGVNSYEDD